MKNPLIFLSLLTAVALSADITGTVVDLFTGIPVQNAKVRSALSGDTVLTDGLGNFRIGNIISPVTEHTSLVRGATLSLTSKNLSLSLPKVAVVNLSISQVNGRSQILHKGNLSAGAHTFTLTKMAPGIAIMSGTIAGVAVTQKLVIGESSTMALGGSSTVPVSTKSRAASLDTLWVEKSGYWSQSIVVDYVTTTVDSVKLVKNQVDGLVGYGQKLISGGSFSMGDSGNYDGALPTHYVVVSSFYMDSTEVTRSEFAGLMGYDPSYFKFDILAPVERVSWYDAVLYCNARSKAEGKDTVYTYSSKIMSGNSCTSLAGIAIDYSKKGYRLPTEAEWEYACRAGTTTIAYWGAVDIIGLKANSWTDFNSGGSTHTVATKLPNAFGLYDMVGNVSEWCNDWYGPYSSSFETNPVGPSGYYRVIRGACYGDYGYNVFASACRSWENPVISNGTFGFRCVLPQ